nr:uncharacterized mitochondrial protein AtMg00810-like [Tanacetum cinerariifolium]
MGQDRQMQMIGGNGNGTQNQIGNGNLVAVRAEGNAAGHNGNQIRCYNYKGVGHFARDYTVRPRRRDAAYLQIQLLIAQKEEAVIQLQAEEYDLMAAATDLEEIEEVNANCFLMANLQQASSSGTQTDSTPVYDSDGSVEVHENCDNNEIFNMFTQEEQYTKPTEKHLKEVKRIFRYLRGTVNTGLWYTKDSGFELTGFSDADYAECKDFFKSTSGGAQFLGEKLMMKGSDIGIQEKKAKLFNKWERFTSNEGNRLTDDQAIQTIVLGLPEDIYTTVDSCETAQEIWLRVQQIMKGSDIGIQEKKAKLFNE